METTGNQNVDLNSQFGTIVATHPHLQLNRNSILSRPPSINFVVHPCPSFARFCESRISSLGITADHYFSFPIPHSPLPIAHCPLPIAHCPLPIPHSPFIIFHFPFPIPHSPFPIPHCPFPIPHSLFPIPVLLTSTVKC